MSMQHAHVCRAAHFFRTYAPRACVRAEMKQHVVECRSRSVRGSGFFIDTFALFKYGFFLYLRSLCEGRSSITAFLGFPKRREFHFQRVVKRLPFANIILYSI